MSESKKLSSEVASQLDLSVIRYSRVLEDHRVLSAALNIVPEQDTVLSITRWGLAYINQPCIYKYILAALETMCSIFYFIGPGKLVGRMNSYHITLAFSMYSHA